MRGYLRGGVSGRVLWLFFVFFAVVFCWARQLNPHGSGTEYSDPRNNSGPIFQKRSFRENTGSLIPSVLYVTGYEDKKDLRQWLIDNDDYVVHFNKRDYISHILSEPRKYDYVILFGTRNSKACSPCPQYSSEFLQIARAYEASYFQQLDRILEEKDTKDEAGNEEDWQNAFEEEGEKKGENTRGKKRGKNEEEIQKVIKQKLKRYVIFGEVDLMANRDIVELHGFKHIPFIIHIPYDKPMRAHGNRRLFEKKDILDISIHNKGNFIDSILMWLNRKTGQEVRITGSRFVSIKLIFPIFFLIILLFFSLSCVKKYPLLIPILSIFIQGIATCGFFHSIKNNLPFSGPGLIFRNTTRTQYLTEGLLMSFLTILCGTSLMAAASLGRWGVGRRENITEKCEKSSAKCKRNTEKCEKNIKKFEKKTDKSERIAQKQLNQRGSDLGKKYEHTLNKGAEQSWIWRKKYIFLSQLFFDTISDIFSSIFSLLPKPRQNWTPKKPLTTAVLNTGVFYLINVAGILFALIPWVYKLKAPWYAPHFFPSPDMRRGPLSSDRGTVF